MAAAATGRRRRTQRPQPQPKPDPGHRLGYPLPLRAAGGGVLRAQRRRRACADDVFSGGSGARRRACELFQSRNVIQQLREMKTHMMNPNVCAEAGLGFERERGRAVSALFEVKLAAAPQSGKALRPLCPPRGAPQGAPRAPRPMAGYSARAAGAHAGGAGRAGPRADVEVVHDGVVVAGGRRGARAGEAHEVRDGVDEELLGGVGGEGIGGNKGA